MTVKVAINGFGRIGGLVARAMLERGGSDLELVAINDLADAKSNAWLFSRDSVHGRYPGEVAAEGNDLLVDISESTVVDQVGFATLVGAHARAARAGRRLRFTGADERTTRLLRRAGLARLLAETPAPAVALRRSRFAVG